MCCAMRALALLCIVGALIGWGIATRPPPADLVHGDPGPAVTTNGDRWRAACRIEAGRSKVDQEDCFSRHALGAAFESSRANTERALRAVR